MTPNLLSSGRIAPAKLLALGVLLAASLLLASPGQATKSLPIEVSAARAQLMPDMGVVYLNVKNKGARSDRLLSVQTTAAESSAMHESVTVGEMASMRELAAGVPIAPHSTVRFESGGKHIMLMDLTAAGKDARSIELQLKFEHAGKILVSAPVSAMGE
jgi:periplasmic copper chaperone A